MKEKRFFSYKQKPFQFMFEVNFIEVLNKFQDSKLYWKFDIDRIFTYKQIMIPLLYIFQNYADKYAMNPFLSGESCFIFLSYRCLGFPWKDYLEEVKLCLEKYV